MYKVIVITDPETADGFRFAGVNVVSVDTPDSAREQVKLLLDSPDAGILAIKESIEMAGERRAYLARLIHRAVGFDITLRGSQGE
jgi:vacuolar-type H+-ATPase subunit F/Vma7